MNYIWLANVLVWLGIGGYLVFLAKKNRELEQKIEEIKNL